MWVDGGVGTVESEVISNDDLICIEGKHLKMLLYFNPQYIASFFEGFDHGIEK